MWGDIVNNITNIASPTIQMVGIGVVGYVYQKASHKFEVLEMKATKAKISLEKKLEKSEVREIVDDKLVPIGTILNCIKEDISEIKQQLKR